MFRMKPLPLSHALALILHLKQQGLCISRGTAPVINFTIILIILPVCKTFNKLVHKALSRVSVQLLAFYLEKLKVIHQCLAVMLVFTSGEWRDVWKIVFRCYNLFHISAIHSVAHFVNAINFVQNYDSKMSDINWARDEDDVSSTSSFKFNN